MHTTYRWRNHSIDKLPRHPTYDMEDSPATGVKTRTRVRGKRASSSSKDNEQRPTTKRRCKKKGIRVNVEAKLGVEPKYLKANRTSSRTLMFKKI
jgi:hypothetical protein